MPKDYTPFITGLFADKPKFVSTIALTAGGHAAAADVANSLLAAFDVDTAIGAQLDVVGLWVGIPRTQVIPIVGVFFAWNIPTFGWNQANWKGALESSTSVIVLDDETYRTVIKARIALNYWDGANDSANALGDAIFASEGVSVRLVDNMDMSITVDVTGEVSALMKALIEQSQLFPKPGAVRVNSYTYSVENSALYLDGAWSLNNVETLDGVRDGV